MNTWPVEWEDIDAQGPQDFQTRCRNRWANVRTDLEPRELEDALEQCKESRKDLEELRSGEEACDVLRALYVE